MSTEPELFGSAETTMLSPKLRWLRDNDLETEEIPNGGMECPETGDWIPKWVCRVKHPRFSSGLLCPNEAGWGETEQDAIAEYAVKAGRKLWFEEGL